MKDKTYDGMILQDRKHILNVEITVEKRKKKEEAKKVED